MLFTDGWGARTGQPVIVVNETPKRYRVLGVNDALRLPMRGRGLRVIYRPATALVPKYAVKLEALTNG